MTNEQAQKILDEMQGVEPSKLNDEAKKLFEAIMKIADERDKIKQEYDKNRHILQNQLDLANADNIKKDKIIDLMTEEISKNVIPHHNHKIFNTKEDNKAKDYWKEYFESKVEEL